MAASEYEELERRVAQRDPRAFEELQRLYDRIVHFFVLSRVSSPRLADEIASEVFDRAWERVDRYRWQDWSFHVWVLRIAREQLDERGFGDRPGAG